MLSIPNLLARHRPNSLFVLLASPGRFPQFENRCLNTLLHGLLAYSHPTVYSNKLCTGCPSKRFAFGSLLLTHSFNDHFEASQIRY